MTLEWFLEAIGTMVLFASIAFLAIRASKETTRTVQTDVAEGAGMPLVCVTVSGGRVFIRRKTKGVVVVVRDYDREKKGGGSGRYFIRYTEDVVIDYEHEKSEGQ